MGIKNLKPETEKKENPFVSIVVAARNENENLRKLIPKLLSQDYENFEIIISLDRCSDSSAEYLREAQRDDIRIKFLDISETPVKWDGKKYALDQAIKSSGAEWLVFLDADCIPASPFWLTHYLTKMNPETEIILGLSPYIKLHGFLNHLIQYETAVTALRYLGQAVVSKPYMGVGRNIAYRKSTYTKVGGFHGMGIEGITGGDDDLLVQKIATRRNTRVVTHQESQTYSIPKRTLSSYFNQKKRHLSVGKYYQNAAKRLNVYWSLTHLILWISFLFLVTFSDYKWGTIAAFVAFIVMKGLFLVNSPVKGRLTRNPLLWVLLDFCYALGLPIMGLVAMLTKKTKWN